MAENRKNWSHQQDQAILSLIKKYGSKKWALISQKMKERFPDDGRSGKQCRERWHNHLCPKINKEPWTREQLKLIFDLHRQYGNKWTQIAKLLKGRTDNAVKNQYYSALRKGLRRMCKVLGTQNSTTKIKKIKPNVLSKLISNFTQFNFGDGESQQQFYDILFELANEDRFQQMKQNSIPIQDRQKMEYILQKVLDSKYQIRTIQQPTKRRKHKSSVKQSPIKVQTQEQKIDIKPQIICQKMQIQQNQNDEKFQFNVDLEESAHQHAGELTNQKKQHEVKHVFNFDTLNYQQCPDYECGPLRRQDSTLSVIKDDDNYVKSKVNYFQPEKEVFDQMFDFQNNQNLCQSFFAKSPCFSSRNQIPTPKVYQNHQFMSTNDRKGEDLQKVYDDIVKEVKNRIQSKTVRQKLR